MKPLPPLAYYISAHGYGHGVRSCDILRAFRRRWPDVPLLINTTLPEALLRNRLGREAFTLRRRAFDVGMVQLDSVRVDVGATLAAVSELYARRTALVKEEAVFLRERGVRMVVVDIPALPVEAARRAETPALAVGNFAWDWIYSPFADQDRRWKPLIEQLARGYAQTELLLRLPFAEEMKAFPRKEDLPLVATPGWPRREEIARAVGCASEKKWVLLSFTSLDWSDAALDKVERLSDYEFFTVLPLEWRRTNIHAIDREAFGFSDVLASVDAVVSKPGFGLLSDCIVNAKPLLYVDRTDFIEYPILVSAVERYLKNEHLPMSALYAGELRECLERLWNRPEPPGRIAHDGAARAAHRMADFYWER